MRRDIAYLAIQCAIDHALAVNNRVGLEEDGPVVLHPPGSKAKRPVSSEPVNKNRTKYFVNLAKNNSLVPSASRTAHSARPRQVCASPHWARPARRVHGRLGRWRGSWPGKGRKSRRAHRLGRTRPSRSVPKRLITGDCATEFGRQARLAEGFGDDGKVQVLV